MNIANWNRELLTVVLILLFLVGLVLIKILLHGSSQLEWGSVSDLVSAACNIAMAGAAVYAAWNANSWLAQKQYESASKHISNLLEERDKIIVEISTLYFDIATLHGRQEKIIEFTTNVRKLSARIFLLKKSLDACNRWSVNVPNKLYEDYKLLLEYCNTCLDLSIIANPNNNQLIVKLDELREEINKNSDFLKKRIDDIFVFTTKL
ncbi:Uncharacterised protein [Cedecea lapagei]|uniref:Uncharacterized protein n=1 Tax=Cedecea lapagei TaxID=158823 RepID=A0A447V430_9ENTR|nr:hypothetical protein [Cedecea lapagei]VEB98813.1 Uncharacterised protein [Cedecea lapagei]